MNNKTKYIVKYIGKDGKIKKKRVNKVVKIKETTHHHNSNPNLLTDQVLSPYMILKNGEKIEGAGEIKNNRLIFEMKGLKEKLPLKLYLMGDVGIDEWEFEYPNEIEFSFKSKSFSGILVGCVRNNYVFIDLLENSKGAEAELNEKYFPYSISML